MVSEWKYCTHSSGRRVVTDGSVGVRSTGQTDTQARPIVKAPWEKIVVYRFLVAAFFLSPLSPYLRARGLTLVLTLTRRAPSRCRPLFLLRRRRF